MLGDFPDGVFGCGPTVAFVSGFLSFGVGAVLAFLDGGAGEVVWVFGEVVLAVFFGDTVGFGEGVDSSGVAAVAAASGLAVDDDLGGEGDVGPGSVSGDVYSVGEGAGGALSPAGAAVGGDVLVFAPGEVVDTADVSPVPGFGEVFEVDVFVGAWTGDVFWDE